MKNPECWRAPPINCPLETKGSVLPACFSRSFFFFPPQPIVSPCLPIQLQGEESSLTLGRSSWFSSSFLSDVNNNSSLSLVQKQASQFSPIVFDNMYSFFLKILSYVLDPFQSTANLAKYNNRIIISRLTHPFPPLLTKVGAFWLFLWVASCITNF